VGAWVNDAIAAKWEASRNCYPNEKDMMPYCSIALLSPVQAGKRLRLMAFVDQNNKLIGRMLCSADEVLPQRTCYDPDAGIVSREMLDSRTNTWST
jgi:hypothetical protein